MSRKKEHKEGEAWQEQGSDREQQKRKKHEIGMAIDWRKEKGEKEGKGKQR